MVFVAHARVLIIQEIVRDCLEIHASTMIILRHLDCRLLAIDLHRTAFLQILTECHQPRRLQRANLDLLLGHSWLLGDISDVELAWRNATFLHLQGSQILFGIKDGLFTYLLGLAACILFGVNIDVAS